VNLFRFPNFYTWHSCHAGCCPCAPRLRLMVTDTKQYLFFFFSGLQPSLNNKRRNCGEKADFRNTTNHPLNPVQLNNGEDTGGSVQSANICCHCVESFWPVRCVCWNESLSARTAQIAHSRRGHVSGEPKLLGITVLSIAGYSSIPDVINAYLKIRVAFGKHN